MNYIVFPGTWPAKKQTPGTADFAAEWDNNPLKAIELFVIKQQGIQIKTKDKKRVAADGRALFGALAFVFTKASLHEIGDHIGKDHSTIIHYRKMVSPGMPLCNRFEVLKNTLAGIGIEQKRNLY